jgi:hypothetical protein
MATSTTRTRTLLTVLAGGLAAFASGPAQAQRAPKRAPVAVAGSFETSFEKVSDNCKANGMALDKATVTIREPKASRLEIAVPSLPSLEGTVSRGGKFKAEAKRATTAAAGVEGRFSAAGKVEGKKLEFVLIAEYYEAGKPLCTQSWNASPRK